jgi:hypothetical protein
MTYKAPLKRFYRGEDVDNLPREKLLEVIDILERQLQSANSCARSIIEINELARKRRNPAWY